MDRAGGRGRRGALSRLRPRAVHDRRAAGPRCRAADPLTTTSATPAGEAPPEPARDGSALPRAIGRLALTGLVLNSVIGSSVFGLPSIIAARLGSASPWAWAAAGLGMALVVASFAELASRLNRAGGTYLYARVAFGRLAGIEMAWLTYLVRLTAAATNANLFIIYLAEFWPAVTGAVPSRAILGLVLLPLATANYRGVRKGVGTSSVFAVAKLAPLALFVGAGLFVMVSTDAPVVTTRDPPADAGTWLEVILLLVFAYGGFESALLPLGEAKDPRRDAPVALFTALGLCALLYTLVQLVVLAMLADPASTDRPLAAAAHVFLGPLGGWLMAAGALVSVYGYLAAAMVNVPRLTYAMAAEGDLPHRLAAVHPRFRTPHVSVVLFALVIWAFAASGSFLQNLSLSAVSRLLTYGMVCVALIVLRRRERERGDVEPAWFRVPAGNLVAGLGLAFSAVLAVSMKRLELAVLAGTLACGLLHWLWMRGKKDGERR